MLETPVYSLTRSVQKKKMQPGGGKIQAGNGNTDRKLMLTSSLNHKIVMVLSTWEITEQSSSWCNIKGSV